MVDAFEARLQFSKTLTRLTAAPASLRSASLYLLKHRSHREDLYSVILEKLQSESNPNFKVNIIYFLEMLCELSLVQGYMDYVEYIRRDLVEICDFAAPVEGGGCVNIEAVRMVLKSLKEKGVLDDEEWKGVDEMLVDRNREEQENQEQSSAKRRRFDDKMIEQRMNEDRQRHKREKEHAWQVAPPTAEKDEEFEQLWANTSDLNEDDYEIMREENEILRQSTMD
ncbi:hypothetical protein BJ508DRAFT_362287 [Ascobolus immersus RN42]|uniref:CID domain-containing protein n=1 Tax=Ascobolus immersus RN42 TaxID=1160509 RepID=A0A3N4I405_ASCIM|nr:hypothetical protein BJ508DRAFT_362287 [Ascobolus immersus RN42]